MLLGEQNEVEVKKGQQHYATARVPVFGKSIHTGFLAGRVQVKKPPHDGWIVAEAQPCRYMSNVTAKVRHLTDLRRVCE